MAEPIRGKVACVLNTREFAINKGSEDGVRVGMFFDVIGSQHNNIKNPDTKEVLGSIVRPKVRVKIVDVEVKLSVATTYRREDVGIRRPFVIDVKDVKISIEGQYKNKSSRTFGKPYSGISGKFRAIHARNPRNPRYD